MALDLATEAARAGKLAVQEHNKRECKVLETVKTYVDAQIDADVLAANAGVKVLKAILKTTVGGAAAEDVAITGVAATDVVLVTLHTAGTNAVSVVKAVTATNKVTITFSGDPGNDAKVNILVVRPA
jgi:hypothetical protein